MTRGLEMLTTKTQEAVVDVAELKMLIFLLGVTTRDRIRNEYVRGIDQAERFGDYVSWANKTWMVFTYAEEGTCIFSKDVDDRAARQEGKRKGTEKIRGFHEGEHAQG